jgi:glycerophosphoryl diester phosphodiesterase
MLTMLVVAAGSVAEKLPEIIAHRGENKLAPENTLAAFRLAWQRGADAVELDVHLTADGYLVVCHDKDTKRMADKNLVIAQSTLAELRKLTFGPPESGQKIPLLSEVLETIPEGKRLFVEVKIGPEAVPVLKKDIEASHKRAEQVVIISFQKAVIAEAKRRLPQHRAFWLADFKRDKKTKRWSPTVDKLISQARAIHADGIDLGYADPFDRACAEKIRAAGFELYAWTIDSPEVARRLIDFGVVGITTNRAGWLREQLGGKTGARDEPKGR